MTGKRHRAPIPWTAISAAFSAHVSDQHGQHWTAYVPGCPTCDSYHDAALAARRRDHAPTIAAP